MGLPEITLRAPFSDEPVTLGEEFYNTVVVPMALLLAMLMAVGPLIRYANAPGALVKRLIAPGIAVVAAVLGAGFWSVHGTGADTQPASMAWAMGSAAVAAFTVTCITEDFIRTLGAFGRSAIRRWGGQLVHLGMIMIVVGVAGSSRGTSKSLALKPGQVEQVGKYTVRSEGVEELAESNYIAGEAKIGVSSPGTDEIILRPQRRQYNKSSKANSEVAVHTTLVEDVYVILSGWQGETVHIKVLINPLLLWIWIGGIAMSLGSFVCLVTPGRRRSIEVVSPPVPTDVPSTVCPEAPQ